MCILYVPISTWAGALKHYLCASATCRPHCPSRLFPRRPSRRFPRHLLWDPGMSREGIWLRREPPGQAAGILNCGRCPHAVSHVTRIHPALFLKFLQGRAKLSAPEELPSAFWGDSLSVEMPSHLSLSLLRPAGISFKAPCSP